MGISYKNLYILLLIICLFLQTAAILISFSGYSWELKRYVGLRLIGPLLIIFGLLLIVFGLKFRKKRL